MDELAIARTKLAHLEGDERQLLEQLSDIRVAAVAQSKRTEEPVRKRPPSSASLRNHTRQFCVLLSVEQTYAKGDPGTCIAALEGRDAKPAKFLVSVEIGSGPQLDPARESPTSWDSLGEGLDLLIPYANRCGSLSIYPCSSTSPMPMPQFILNCIGGIEFPSLKRALLDLRVTTFSTFLSSTDVSVLERLETRPDHHKLR
ncbi:hypothetical protein M404DRAFT_759769 [Pisolithus tinctorius Marx 270]|uniref:Uncharacterized protein n=1 Tax=Pisolithus tinctorius Marx 270 TaxID=870435 RepID=A0A0C3IV33_PISTI|nr:hypothetical protein M404DRAFT_759769 [Pisolithus tinctorius Marx 270]